MEEKIVEKKEIQKEVKKEIKTEVKTEVKTEKRVEQTSGFGNRPTGRREYKPRGRSSFRNSKNFYFKKKVCFFCKNKEAVIDYKDVGLLRRFIAENGKISPRRFTGTCAKHQRKLSVEIKKARQMALLQYTDRH